MTTLQGWVREARGCECALPNYVLKREPSAQAIAQTKVESLGTFLYELAPRQSGLSPPQELLGLAKASISSGRPSQLAHRACAFSAISWTILRRSCSSCSPRSTRGWTRTPRPKPCWACRNLDRRRWRCCGLKVGLNLNHFLQYSTQTQPKRE